MDAHYRDTRDTRSNREHRDNHKHQEEQPNTTQQPPDNSEALTAFAYLNRVVEGPHRGISKLLEIGKSGQEIAHGIYHREAWVGEELLRSTQERYLKAKVDSENDLIIAGRENMRLIYPGHPEWPQETLDQAFRFLHHCDATTTRNTAADAFPPHCLWVRGENLISLTSQAVAIVGTRAISSYGRAATQTICAGLAKHQWTIISGGAAGVDRVAHLTALEEGTPTVVVQACGLDRAYPQSHRDLYARIVEEGGAVVSEYPPTSTPLRHRFLSRNRLVAALTQGTIVMEAAWRSGALSTLTWAESFGRATMAVPGPILSAQSLGCHQRIRDGRATLISSADEAREILSQTGAVDVEGNYELIFPASPIQKLSANELKVYDAIGFEASESRKIAENAGLSLALCIHLLVELERRNLVRREGSLWRRLETGAGDLQ